jgi:D-glycero-D-manno-heptose 1,7-bisphosphate phosphatase
MKSRAVFLDRDGVLNQPVIRDGKPFAPTRVEDVEIYAGLREQLQRLKDRGFFLIVVTNQPDVVRGTTSRETVDGINRTIAREIPAIDRILVCFHDNGDGCGCRKPRPGMLLAGAKEFDVDLQRSYMVGDRRGRNCRGQPDYFRRPRLHRVAADKIRLQGVFDARSVDNYRERDRS